MPDGVREGSAIAVAPGGKALYVADEDHRSLTTVSLPLTASTKPAKMELPGAPAQVLVLGATVLVTIRALPDGSGALLFLEARDGSSLTETGRVALPGDAWGIAAAPDGKRALVTSAWTSRVSAVDLATRAVLWTREVAREPRGVTFGRDGDSAFISHLVGSSLTRIQAISSDPRVESIALPAAPYRSPPAEKLDASLGFAIVADPRRERLFAPRHALGALGSSVWFGTASVDVLDASSAKPVATARGWNARKSFMEPVAHIFERQQGAWWGTGAFGFVNLTVNPFVQPRAAVYRKTQDTLLVASEGGAHIAELDATMSDPILGVVRTYGLWDERTEGPAGGCTAPSGIALSADERSAYVYCRTSDAVVTVLLPEGEGSYASPPLTIVKIAEPPSNPDLDQGRRLFYSASDEYVSGGLGCAGCHPEGRDDGYVWHEVAFSDEAKDRPNGFSNFFGSASAARTVHSLWQSSVPKIANESEAGVGYPRQTPMIVGRLKAKGPYGWLAESATLEDRLIAGFGLHRWNQLDQSGFMTARARQLIPFVREGLVPPPSSSTPLTQEEELGKRIFNGEAAGCAACHTPETDYTNRSVAAFPPYPQRGYVDEKGAAFKTPSLLFVGGSAPYFHDGRYATLEELVEKNGDKMGKTSQLSAEEKKALVAFLRRL